MRVLQINSFFSVGGPPRIVNGLYDTLIEQGHVCKIAAARESQYVPKDSIQIGKPYRAYINAAEARLLDNDGMSAKDATNRLITRIIDYNPDIIHLHNLHGYYINIERLFHFLKESNKPVVWTLHDCWAFTGHCAHFDLIKCEKWMTECADCPQKREYPSSYVLSMSRRNFNAKKSAFLGVQNLCIVTPSNWLASLVKESFLGCYPIRVINNGIDLSRFVSKPSDILDQYGIKGKKIILGVAQNWAEKKGFEDFIKLAELLDETYKVVMIGLSNDLLKKVPSKVLGLGRTRNEDELVRWYTAAEAFVNLTYQDTFPTVNIEALACGTPVITYNTGGSPEAVDMQCGIIVPTGDVVSVIRAINRLSIEDDKSTACSERAKLFSRRQKFQEYIDLYSELLGEGR